MERSCAKQGGIYLFLLPGSHLVCKHAYAHLAWVLTDGEPSPWKSVPALTSWKELRMGLGSCKHRCHGENMGKKKLKSKPRKDC